MTLRTWPTATQSTPIQRPKSNDHSLFHMGDRVTVNQSLGTIRYIGTTEFKAGTWIGIELDILGTGKNDGSIQGKRYFICPPNTGLFILATKLAKQQCHHRPSTPYQKLKKIQTDPPPPLPSSSLPPTPPAKPSPPPVPKKESTLEKRLEQLELENKQLKQSVEKYETKNKNLKKTSMESIEILGKMLQSQYEKVQLLNKKNQDLVVEAQEMKKASLDAIESYEISLKSWEKEKLELNKSHQQTVDRYLKDISVLEFVLKSKTHKESDLADLIRKERQYSGKLVLELKNLKQQYENSMRWSYRVMDRLDTPIEEDDEECCPLCDQTGHDLLHCQLVAQKVT